MVASCAGVIRKDHRPARVRFSQPPGSVRSCCEAIRQISECGEVKGEALNLTQSSEKIGILGLCRSFPSGRRPCGVHVKDECSVDTPGSKTASSHTTTGS